MAHKTLYLCNGGKEKCKNKRMCLKEIDTKLEGEDYSMSCHHTSDPRYAKNGAIEDPWNYPDRFEVEEDSEGMKYYWERRPMG